MSFLTRTSATTLRTLRFTTSRAAFSTTFRAQKSAVDSTLDAAKETLKSIDRTVSDAAVKGIEKGRTLLPLSSTFCSLFEISSAALHFSYIFDPSVASYMSSVTQICMVADLVSVYRRSSRCRPTCSRCQRWQSPRDRFGDLWQG